MFRQLSFVSVLLALLPGVASADAAAQPRAEAAAGAGARARPPQTAPAQTRSSARPSSTSPSSSAPQASAEVAALSARAKQAMAANRFDEAITLYRQILARVPDEPGILMNLGMALSMSGQPQDAIDPLSRALKLRPSLLPAALFLGNSYLDLNRPADAVAPLRTYVAAQPADLQARQMLASALLMSGDAGEAAAAFRKLAQLAPADARSYYGLVQAYDALSQEAVDALEKSTDADTGVYASLLVADALESDGKYEPAFALYKQSLEKLPRLRATHDALGRIYTKTGHKDWAARQQAKSQQMPLDCVARKAECEFRAGRYLTAISALATRTDAESHYWRTRAYTELAAAALAKLAAMPPSQELHELRGELYRNQRRHLQSVAEMKAALAFAPNDPRLKKELAKSLYFARDWESARTIFADLSKAQPGDPELQFFYGDTLLQEQQAEAALPHLEAAVARDASMAAWHAALGRAYVQLNRFTDAIPHLEAVVSQDEDGSLHYQLARAYQSTNQPDRAKPLLDKYQELQRLTQSQSSPAAAPPITPPQ